MKHLDTFVQYKPRHTIIFMEVLEVTDTIDTKEICNVSWYMVCKDEIIIQSDFPMCATDGEFVNFVPIPRHSFLEARSKCSFQKMTKRLQVNSNKHTEKQEEK